MATQTASPRCWSCSTLTASPEASRCGLRQISSRLWYGGLKEDLRSIQGGFPQRNVERVEISDLPEERARAGPIETPGAISNRPRAAIRSGAFKGALRGGTVDGGIAAAAAVVNRGVRPAASQSIETPCNATGTKHTPRSHPTSPKSEPPTQGAQHRSRQRDS